MANPLSSTKTGPALPPGHSLSRGVWSINVSVFAFVAGDTIVKFLGRSFPPNELLFLRSMMIMAALAMMMLVTGRRPRFKSLLSLPMLARGFFDGVNILSFTAAVIHMQMAELYAILLMSPLLMTILAVFFFREPVGYRRWLAIVLGFCGVLLVVKPDPHALDQWALMGILAALTGALRETVTQKIDRGTPTADVAFYAAVCTAAGTLLAGWNEPWPPLTQPQYLLLLVYAGTWLIGAFLLVRACRFLPLSLVAAFRYTMLIWGGISGYLVFGDVPDVWSLIGAAVIAGCGLYALHREVVRQRAIASDIVTLS